MALAQKTQTAKVVISKHRQSGILETSNWRTLCCSEYGIHLIATNLHPTFLFKSTPSLNKTKQKIQDQSMEFKIHFSS